MSGITVTDLGVAHTTATGATCVYTLTAGQNIPSGALIVVIVDEYVNAGGSVSGTGSCKDTVNTGGYTAITAIANDGSAADGRGQIFYHLNASAVPPGDAITYTKTATGNDTAMSCFYVTGIATTGALDTSVTATTTGNMPTAAGSAAFSLTSGTPAVAGELFVAGVSAYDTSASSWISTLDPASVGWATPFDWSGVPTNGKATVAGASYVNAGTGTVTFAPTVVVSGVARHFAAWVLGFQPLVTTDEGSIATSFGGLAQVFDVTPSTLTLPPFPGIVHPGHLGVRM